MRPGRQRAVAAVLIVVASVASAVVATQHWQSIQIAWWGRQCAADRRPFDGMWYPNEAASPWYSLVDSGNSGFHALGRLLEHEDAAVWAKASTFMEIHLGLQEDSLRDASEMPADRIALFQDLYPVGYLRFVLLMPFQQERRIQLRRAFPDRLAGGGYASWCGPSRNLIPPTEGGIAFLRKQLLESRRIPGLCNMYDGALSERAVHALCAMLEPGVPPAPGDRLRTLVVETLGRFIESDVDPERRLHAAHRLLSRIGAGLPPDARHSALADWEATVRIGLPGASVKSQDEWESVFFTPLTERPLHPVELAALLHVRHARVDRVLARLDMDPKGRALIDRALALDLPALGRSGVRRPWAAAEDSEGLKRLGEGDRQQLEQLVASAILPEGKPGASALENAALILANSVEGFPIWSIVSQKGPRIVSDARSEAGLTPDQKRLEEWWRVRGERLRFDPEKHLWVVRE